ncbi:hypothetical protein A2U01_0103134, partial [Trifolium medium]|nr:hypothetical protein [Trifolium medium]
RIVKLAGVCAGTLTLFEMGERGVTEVVGWWMRR